MAHAMIAAPNTIPLIQLSKIIHRSYRVGKTINSPLLTYNVASKLSLMRTYVLLFIDAYLGSGTLLVKDELGTGDTIKN